MPIEVNIWKINAGNISKIDYSSLESENKLEDILEKDIGVLSDDLLVIGRQVPTNFGKFIDLLTIDIEGKVSVIELKRNKTPREVVAVDRKSYNRIIEVKPVDRKSYNRIIEVKPENGHY